MVETVVLFPIDGQFDVGHIEAHLDALTYVSRDPLDPNGTYFMCDEPQAVDFYRQKRIRHPDRFPYIVLIDVHALRVDVHQQTGVEMLRKAREFVSWMLEQFPCRVVDDMGQDWTERAYISVDVLYPPHL